MNHGFFNTTQQVSVNPCTGRAPFHQGKRKHGRANPNLKQLWSFFSTSEGLFTWSGCLKVRPLTRSTTRRFLQTFVNGWEEEEDLKCGRTAYGFFTKTTRRHTTPCLSRLFDETQDHRVGTSTVLTWPSPMRLLFPKIKSALKGTGFESVYAVKAKATELMNKLSEDDLQQHCFQQWKIRMERCRNRGGKYIEGDNISIV